jgi:hypothetical protein
MYLDVVNVTTVLLALAIVSFRRWHDLVPRARPEPVRDLQGFLRSTLDLVFVDRLQQEKHRTQPPAPGLPGRGVRCQAVFFASTVAMPDTSDE